MVRFLILIQFLLIAKAEPLSNCNDKLSTAGVDLKNFPLDVAHGIHSMRIEHVKHFFDVQVPINNDIPTVNTNLKGEKILKSIGNLTNDPKLKSLFMETIDFIFSRNDDEETFSIRSCSNLEQVAHEAHMNELYIRVKPIYEEMLKNPSMDNITCSCITDEANNGVLKALNSISNQVRKERPSIPTLTNSTTWKTWKTMLTNSMLPKRGIQNVALYLYCKLASYR